MLEFPESQYQHLEASLHDAFWDAEDARSEVALIAKTLEQNPGKALEIGSGSGRLLLPLLQKGHDIEGLEPSADMLAFCQKNADPAQPPRLHLSDLTSFQAEQRYRVIAIPAFTFMLMSDPRAAIEKIRKLLEINGILYLTVFIPWSEIYRDQPENKWFTDKTIPLDDKKRAVCKTRYRIDQIAQTLERDHEYTIIDSKKRILDTQKLTQRLRYFWPRELRLLLEMHGFQILSETSDFTTGQQFHEETGIFTYIAKSGL